MELSKEQQSALELFNNGTNLFISGPGGTGKTELIKRFVTETSKVVQVCAMTGCAALLLKCGAKTIHSWSGIKLGNKPIDETCNAVAKSRYYSRSWRKTQILIIDEVSMMSRKTFDLLNAVGKKIRRNDKPFGGMQIVMVGDFYQLPPVATDDSEPGSSEFCFQSENWSMTFAPSEHIILKTVFRQSDPTYKNILLQIREGELDEEGQELLRTRIIENDSSVKIFPRKNSSERENQRMYDAIDKKLPGYTYTVQVYKTLDNINGDAFDTGTRFRCNNMTETQKEIEVKTLLNSAPMQHVLNLKRGARVMCIKNLNLKRGICNGSQGVVIDFVLRAQSAESGSPDPVVKFDNGEILTIERNCWQSEFFPSIGVGQYPLIWAWAITVHKVQGTTLDTAEVDIGSHIFEYGQTYVALSRIRTLSGLFLTGFDPSKIRANPVVKEFYRVCQAAAASTKKEEVKPKPAKKEKPEKNNTKKIVFTTGRNKITDFWNAQTVKDMQD